MLRIARTVEADRPWGSAAFIARLESPSSEEEWKVTEKRGQESSAQDSCPLCRLAQGHTATGNDRKMKTLTDRN